MPLRKLPGDWTKTDQPLKSQVGKGFQQGTPALSTALPTVVVDNSGGFSTAPDNLSK